MGLLEAAGPKLDKHGLKRERNRDGAVVVA